MAGTVNRLTSLVARLAADGRVIASVQSPLRLDPTTSRSPISCCSGRGPDFYESSHPTAADVLLLVEVADSSLAYDRGPKLALYARHGVPEVWIVDLPGHALEVCREPAADGYADRRNSLRARRCRRWCRASRSSSRPSWPSRSIPCSGDAISLRLACLVADPNWHAI